MRNTMYLGNAIVRRAIEMLRARLPKGWRVVERQPRRRSSQPDALIEVRAKDGSTSLVAIEAKANLMATDVATITDQLISAARENAADGCMVVASYLSRLARERLVTAGVSYLDLTGNMLVSLDRPALFIETRGADQDPAPTPRESRSLKGASAARIVRALCDWRPPVGVRELARRAGTDPGYATRILSLLSNEDVIVRGEKGDVAEVRWQDLIRRWAQDYAVARTNRAKAFLDPRGADALLGQLRVSKSLFALTGSRAIPRPALTAPARTTYCYVEDLDQAAKRLGLREVEAGTNVVLLEPFDPVIFERTRTEEGLTYVAPSQCAVDLLTGSGREPSEASALILWMERNEDAWRA